MTAYSRAACLGIVAGMRSMTAPALASWRLTEISSDEVSDSPLGWFATRPAAYVFGLLALGELVADKLPSVPARTDLGPQVGRALTGALAGSAVCVAEGEGIVEGAVVGALAAVASTHVFYHLRKWLGESVPLPDRAVAVCEDAFALWLGQSALPQVAE